MTRENAIVRFGGVEHLPGFTEFAAHRLLQVEVPAVAEHLADALDMERNRQQDLDCIDRQTARGEFGCRGKCLRLGPFCLSLGTTLWIGINERHHLDIGIVSVRSDVQVIDATETDDGSPDRPVIGNERHKSLPSLLVGPASGADRRAEGRDEPSSAGSFASSRVSPRETHRSSGPTAAASRSTRNTALVASFKRQNTGKPRFGAGRAYGAAVDPSTSSPSAATSRGSAASSRDGVHLQPHRRLRRPSRDGVGRRCHPPPPAGGFYGSSVPIEPGSPQPLLVAFPERAKQRRWTVLIRFILAIPLWLSWSSSSGSVPSSSPSSVGSAHSSRVELPDFARRYLARYMKLTINLYTYLYLLTDTFPPFEAEEVVDPGPNGSAARHPAESVGCVLPRDPGDSGGHCFRPSWATASGFSLSSYG